MFECVPQYFQSADCCGMGSLPAVTVGVHVPGRTSMCAGSHGASSGFGGGCILHSRWPTATVVCTDIAARQLVIDGLGIAGMMLTLLDIQQVEAQRGGASEVQTLRLVGPPGLASLAAAVRTYVPFRRGGRAFTVHAPLHTSPCRRLSCTQMVGAHDLGSRHTQYPLPNLAR